MESIRKQACKLREQVAKQQQAVLKRLGSLSNEAVMVDEAEILCHQQLHDLYTSTRAAKHFQRSIVRGVEAFISISLKQMEIVRKLAEDCCKYGAENQNTSTPLVRASTYFGTSHDSIEEERETFLRILGEQWNLLSLWATQTEVASRHLINPLNLSDGGTNSGLLDNDNRLYQMNQLSFYKVYEPLRAQLTGSPLEDARHLTHRYDKLRQEVEAQVAEVLRRRLKSKASGSSESSLKLQNTEARLTELKSTAVALGREATSAMLSVEAQQQQMTFQKLLTMVDAERSYHQHALAILEKLHSEMILEKLPQEFSLESETVHPNASSKRSDDHEQLTQDGNFFIARAIHPFDAQADGELNLSIDDYVVVREVGPNGWSEGECKGKAGWFPSAYIERHEKAPVSKLL
ncbi:SH3 domain-containing protein 2 isoform X1 [Rosa chinensis]|uniref:SH3 domain-containing protein 2 isoform X1 n=1 Tax=Rosa chinensis TaxID=74649 RepID=UPI000D08BE0A|nr:SH3 domain-containing protein 2 isoform X1 [Rosa chinensis]